MTEAPPQPREDPPVDPYAPQVLPDSGTVVFLATTADTRGGDKEGTVYGAGHRTTYTAADKEFIGQCYLDGKISLVDPLPDPVELSQPTNFPPPKP